MWEAISYAGQSEAAQNDPRKREEIHMLAMSENIQTRLGIESARSWIPLQNQTIFMSRVQLHIRIERWHVAMQAFDFEKRKQWITPLARK